MGLVLFKMDNLDRSIAKKDAVPTECVEPRVPSQVPRLGLVIEVPTLGTKCIMLYSTYRSKQDWTLNVRVHTQRADDLRGRGVSELFIFATEKKHLSQSVTTRQGLCRLFVGSGKERKHFNEFTKQSLCCSVSLE